MDERNQVTGPRASRPGLQVNEEDPMSFSRRAFVKTLGLGGAAALTSSYIPRAHGLDAFWTARLHAQGRPLLLHNNENPLGPGDKALAAVRDLLGSDGATVGRYPFGLVPELMQAIAGRYGVSADNVILGLGSTQILQTATEIFTSATRPLVAATPTYEECAQYADLLGRPKHELGLTSDLKLDLDAMADASKGAGLVFVNNPNNPTATVHSADAINGFIDKVLTSSPDTMILLDEAYHDYVTDRSHKSQYALAAKNPKVMVARTFSKAHGMAGMRVGYVIAHPETIKAMRPVHYEMTLNSPGIAAAIVSIKDPARIEQEAERNTAARQYTIDWFKQAGFDATDSQCNFIFVNTRMSAQEFRDACRKHNVAVGRSFPPYEKTHARISIGTLEQMKQATDAFAQVLGVAKKAAA